MVGLWLMFFKVLVRAAAAAAHKISTEAERGTVHCFFLLRFCPLDCDASVMVVDCAAVKTGCMLDKYVPSPLLLLSFASIAVAAVEKGYAFLCFGRGAAAAANHFSCWLCYCFRWCLCCLQHQYRSRERYRLLFLPSTFLSFTLRCFGRLLLLLFLAASISVLRLRYSGYGC